MKLIQSVFIISLVCIVSCTFEGEAIKTLLSSPEQVATVQSESFTLLKGKVIPPKEFSAQDFNIILLDSQRQPIHLIGVNSTGAFEIKDLIQPNSRIYLQAINQLNPSFILEAVADIPSDIENKDILIDITVNSTALSIISQRSSELPLKDIKGGSQFNTQINATTSQINHLLSSSGEISTINLLQKQTTTTTSSASFPSDSSTDAPQASQAIIQWFAPNRGFTGDQFLVVGRDFDSNAKLFINNLPVEILQLTAQQIVAKIPEEASSGNVSIQTSQGLFQTRGLFTILNPDLTPTPTPSPTPESSASPPIAPTPSPSASASTTTELIPLISNLTPAAGIPGAQINIDGSNFDSTAGNNEVSFDGKQASIVSATESQLTVIVPEVSDTVSVTVRTNSRLSNTKQFTVNFEITSISPNSGATGDTITINGQGFSSNASVNFNGISGNIDSVSNTRITVKVPPLSTTGPINVVSSSATASSETFQKIFLVSSFAGNGTGGFNEGQGSGAQFNFPRGITSDSQGNLYIGDTANQRIRRLTPQGTSSTYAGIGSGGITNGDATTVAEFNSPVGVVFDSNGNMYVADTNNHRIRMITPAGNVSTFAGSGTPAHNDAVGAAADFNLPTGLAIDSNDNIFVADSQNHRIRQITVPGANVTTIAGTGGFGHNDGAAGTAQFFLPVDVAVDSNGDVFVADSFNHVIRKIALPAGTVSTPAGQPSTSAFQDGTGAGARFNSPAGIAFDSNNNLYIADQTNHRIRHMTPAGVVTTFAGNGNTVLVNGDVSVAQFNGPEQLVFAGGNLFVVSQSEHRVRKILF